MKVKAILVFVILCGLSLKQTILAQNSKTNCGGYPEMDSTGVYHGPIEDLLNGYCDHYGYWVPRLLDREWWNSIILPQHFVTRALRSNELAINEIALAGGAMRGLSVWLRPQGDLEWSQFIVRDSTQFQHATTHILYSQSGLEISTSKRLEWQAAGYNVDLVEVFVSDTNPSTSDTPAMLSDWFRQNAIYQGGYSYNQAWNINPGP